MEMNWNEKRQQMKATICIVFDICIARRGALGKGLQIGLTEPRFVWTSEQQEKQQQQQQQINKGANLRVLQIQV